MKTWIKLLKSHSTHKAGDLIETEKAVAEALITAGVAEDAGDGPNEALKTVGLAEFNTALKGFAEGLGTALKDATDQIAAAGRRHTIEPGEQEADSTKSLGDFVAQVVKAGNVSDLGGLQAAQERLSKVYKAEARKGMEESSGGQGGFWTVPTQFENSILMEQAEDAVILPGVTSVSLGARAVEWPALDQYQVPTNGNSAMFGGITVSRKGETSPRDKTQAKPTTIKLEANDLTALTQFSRDLSQDSGGVVESMLTKLIGGAIGFRRDWEHMFGDGVGKPLGYLNPGNKALLTIARTTANLVKYGDVAKMVSRLIPSAQKRAVWVAHPFLLEQFLTLSDAAGNLIYLPLGQPTAQASINPFPRLANLPVLFTEKAPAPGQPGDLSLVDRKAILSGMRSGIEIGLSEHIYFETDQIGLRAKVRDDAQPWLKKKIKLSDGSSGSSEVSAFIALGAAA